MQEQRERPREHRSTGQRVGHGRHDTAAGPAGQPYRPRHVRRGAAATTYYLPGGIAIRTRRSRYSSMTIRVLTVDDHAVVRAGIAAMIANEPDMAMVAEASDGDEAIARFAADRPDVVLMDLRMPRVDGVAAIRAIVATDPAARIVALTTYDGDADIHRALTAGACAYLVKDVLVEELIAAIRSAAAGRRVIPIGVARALAEFTPRIDLTARELEVLRLVAKGLRNQEIARVIGRTTGTVKVHVKNILEKLGVEDRTHAVTLGLQRGIIHLDD
jgi:two-component system, NarL family, response regulator